MTAEFENKGEFQCLKKKWMKKKASPSSISIIVL